LNLVQLDDQISLGNQRHHHHKHHNHDLLQTKVRNANDKYSDELCNGDSADDREIHEEEDMNDDVVDYNGQTNAGYGAVLHDYGTMMDPFWKNNHINYISPGHFLTEPASLV